MPPPHSYLFCPTVYHSWAKTLVSKGVCPMLSHSHKHTPKRPMYGLAVLPSRSRLAPSRSIALPIPIPGDGIRLVDFHSFSPPTLPRIILAFMSIGLTRSDDSSSCSPDNALRSMAETATLLANFFEASSERRSNISFESLPERLPGDFSRPSSPGVTVFCLASVFFGTSIALFAICTGLVDMDIRLEDRYIRYILFLDGLCNRTLNMVEAAGEAFLVAPSRIGSGCIDAAISFSRAAFRIPPWALQIPDQRIQFLYHHGGCIINVVYVARLSIRSRAFTICASFCKLAEQLRRTVLRAAHCSICAIEIARTCLSLGAKRMHVRGRSLNTTICAGATRAAAFAIRLPSGRIYSRAWGAAMRVSSHVCL